MANERRKFTKEFKDQSVRLMEDSGRDATEIAKDLGVPVEYRLNTG